MPCHLLVFIVLGFAAQLGFSQEPPLTELDDVDLLSEGLPIGAKIIGGVLVRPRQYILSLSNQVGSHLCSGALIHPQIAITTATCLETVDMGLAKGISEESQTRRLIVKGVAHPRWTGNPRSGYNIALLKLNYPMEVKKIAKIAPKASVDDDRLTALGFGRLTPSGVFSEDQLQGASMAFLTRSECQQLLGRVHFTYFCAGERETSLCQGDEGASLVVSSTGPAPDDLVGLGTLLNPSCEGANIFVAPWRHRLWIYATNSTLLDV